MSDLTTLLPFVILVAFLWGATGVVRLTDAIPLRVYERWFPNAYAEAKAEFNERQREARIEALFRWTIETDLGDTLGDECDRCNGKGELHHSRHVWPCSWCEGRGYVWDKYIKGTEPKRSFSPFC